jgi:hypothetical protein
MQIYPQDALCGKISSTEWRKSSLAINVLTIAKLKDKHRWLDLPGIFCIEYLIKFKLILAKTINASRKKKYRSQA